MIHNNRLSFKSILLLALFPVIASTQPPPADKSIYYDGVAYSCKISPPSGWILDIDNVRIDNCSAAAYPQDQRYYDTDMIIYFWIYKGDSLNFRKNISLDSLRYLKKDSNLVFKKNDSLTISKDRPVCILVAMDPGGKHKLAEVAYIDAKTEFIVCELKIADRVYFVEAETKLREMLKKISLTSREDE